MRRQAWLSRYLADNPARGYGYHRPPSQYPLYVCTVFGVKNDLFLRIILNSDQALVRIIGDPLT